VKFVKTVVNNKIALVVGVIAAMSVTSAVQAEPITGSISMQGLANLANAAGDPASISTATEVIFVPGYVQVGTSGGDFGTVAAFSPVTMGSPWIFNPSTALPALWTVTGSDGFTFTFDVASDSFTQLGDSLNIIGSGTISSSNPDYDPTAFTWSIYFEDPPSGGPVEFNFSAYTEAVPDGGLTVAFLGLALAGVECFRRKLGKI
jgi:hypothetical protein